MILYARGTGEQLLFFLNGPSEWKGWRIRMKRLGKKKDLRVHSYAPLTKNASTEVKNAWHAKSVPVYELKDLEDDADDDLALAG